MRLPTLPLGIAPIAALALLAATVLPAAAPAQAPAASKLVLEAVEVEPAPAAPDTLCHLEVRIRNGGEAIASAFAFRVRLDEHELAVYRQQIFLDPIAPGETRSLRLYSFWTSETGRPAPASGQLTVEVSLHEARWMRPEKDPEGVLVWKDLGAVEGLPLQARQTLELAQ
jgi:hypothetical protein